LVEKAVENFDEVTAAAAAAANIIVQSVASLIGLVFCSSSDPSMYWLYEEDRWDETR
jgi:hypothetical protein